MIILKRMLNPFMKKNKHISKQIAWLSRSAYPLASTYSDLTLVQEIFMTLASLELEKEIWKTK